MTGTCWASRGTFFENHLCKGMRSGLHAHAKETLELQKRDKYAQCTELVEWAGGEGGSKDNYKG